MVDFNVLLSDDEEQIIQLAIDDPTGLNKKLKKFLKNLFNNLDSDSLTSKLEDLNKFHETIVRISEKPECYPFLDLTLDLLVGHSVFRKIFLSSEYLNSDFRLKLVQLFCWICTNHLEHCKIMQNLVDFVFSSYRATLSYEDQTLLQLLSVFDSNQTFNMNIYHPFIWGENAAKFYAAKHAQKLAFLSTPNIDQLFENFDGKYLRNSLEKFPIQVQMSDKPLAFFSMDPDFNHKKYDPRFLLPLFYHFVSVQHIVKYHKFISYGCLSYTLAALSSYCPNIRCLAYRILARFYHLLECARYPQDRQLWIGLLDYVRSGMQEPDQRLDCVHTVLFTKIIDVLHNPACLLFPTVRNFLIHHQMKPYNYKTIAPLYNVCMTEIAGVNLPAYGLHQKFAITWINDSLQTGSDAQTWHRRKAFSDLLVLYNSPLCVPENKPLIMKILINLSKLIEGCRILYVDCSIFSWINHQLTIDPQLQKNNNNVTPKDSLYRMVVNMWDCVCSQNDRPSVSEVFDESFNFQLIMVLSKIVYKVTDQKRIDAYVKICRKALKHTENSHQKLFIKTLICSNLPMNLEQIYGIKN